MLSPRQNAINLSWNVPYLGVLVSRFFSSVGRNWVFSSLLAQISAFLFLNEFLNIFKFVEITAYKEVVYMYFQKIVQLFYSKRIFSFLISRRWSHFHCNVFTAYTFLIVIAHHCTIKLWVNVRELSLSLDSFCCCFSFLQNGSTTWDFQIFFKLS